MKKLKPLTMKKLLLCETLISTCLVHAQKFEISATYGTSSLYGTTESILDATGSALGSAIASTIFGNPTKIDYPTSNGVFNLSVQRYSQDMKWRYGVDFVYESFNESKSDFTVLNFMSFMPKVDYFWSGSDKKLRLYSGAALGFLIKDYKYINSSTLRETKDSDTLFALNVTPIGLRYGTDFGVFLEPNIGVKSFVQAGVSYQF